MSIEKKLYSMSVNSNIDIDVKLERSTEGNEYYLKVEGKYYKIKRTEKGIEIERRESTIGGTSEENELTVDVIEGSNITAQVEGNTIKITSQDTAGETKINISYGKYNVQCTIKVELKPTENSTPVGEQGYSTENGDIDVIWLNTKNEVIPTPNEPDLYNLTTSTLKPVTWTYDETSKTWSEDEITQTKWYEYKGKEKTDKSDNIESMWANAKNTVNGETSYFVWIPRYAYRITYYEDDAKTKVTGYYDGLGKWNANTGELNYELDPGIETVEYEGEKYIVHPAFVEDTGKKDKEGKELEDFARGGWSNEQSGIWVAKYEMCRTDATDSNKGKNTTFKSIPGVQSARSITIGNMYDYSLKYDNTKESHMMKNSEWGAVAYLTHSKYGRNGHEIDINNSNTYITGNGGDSPSANTTDNTYAYNTKVGAKASTTGNIYGIYDMSGGAFENTACFNAKGTIEDSYSGTMVDNKNSTKYVTVYQNGTDEYVTKEKVQEVSKIGDGIKEILKRENGAWFDDTYSVVCKNTPFSYRSGSRSNSIHAGVFYSNAGNGSELGNASFRIALGVNK